jgi:hypothetical protein
MRGRWRRNVCPGILNLYIRGKKWVSFKPWSLFSLDRRPQYCLGRIGLLVVVKRKDLASV